MSSNEAKVEEIEMSYVQVSEQGSPGKLVPIECEEPEETDERHQEASERTAQPDKEKEAGELIVHIEEYNWPVNNEEFEERDVVVIAINETEEAEHAFDWYMTMLHREENLVVLVHALEIRQRPGIGLFHNEDWKEEKQRILDTRRALHDKYRRKFIDLKLNGAIVSDKGDAGQFIIEEAEKRRATYIITGKRHQDVFHRVFSTSTSDFVLCNSSCTVLVCRMDPKQSQETENSSSSTSESINACV